MNYILLRLNNQQQIIYKIYVIQIETVHLIPNENKIVNASNVNEPSLHPLFFYKNQIKTNYLNYVRSIVELKQKKTRKHNKNETKPNLNNFSCICEFSKLITCFSLCKDIEIEI